MASDVYFTYGDVEIINLSRTAQLAEGIGLDVVWATPESVAWIGEALGESNYSVLSLAPWYDPGVPASAEFAGIVPLSVLGLDDSSMSAATTEYIGDGGSTGRGRNSTQAIVASVAIVALTDRGADFGKRWLDSVLTKAGSGFCQGSDLRYFKHEGADSPLQHRRDVRLTRGTSVTRKSLTACSATWLVTFTLTDNDGHEYGEPVPTVAHLGDTTDSPTGVPSGHGLLVLTEMSCPVYDYTPIYDPEFPALIAPPPVPDLLPDSWRISDGMTFERFWGRINAVEPSALQVAPVITLTNAIGDDARAVRFSIWSPDAAISDQCGPLFSVVANYIPAGADFVIDGEQRVVYMDDGTSVRRCDSLAFSEFAGPVQWADFGALDQLLVTLDLFGAESGADSGSDYPEIWAALSLVPKSY